MKVRYQLKINPQPKVRDPHWETLKYRTKLTPKTFEKLIEVSEVVLIVWVVWVVKWAGDNLCNKATQILNNKSVITIVPKLRIYHQKGAAWASEINHRYQQLQTLTTKITKITQWIRAI